MSNPVPGLSLAVLILIHELILAISIKFSYCYSAFTTQLTLHTGLSVPQFLFQRSLENSVPLICVHDIEMNIKYTKISLKQMVI